ncbi:MAG TPA: hypothetical protein VJU77_02630 [Chthoniobacterales bacterium]|nr:hypothetical protein [Chthoniobacterales bacterium]
MLVVLLILVIYGFEAHARRQFEPTPATQGDQGAYLADAVRMYETNYAAVGERARMPVYPFLLSFLYEPGLTEEKFLERAQTFTVNLSIVLLFLLFLIFRRTFPTIYAVALVSITAFGMFLYRAGMAQPEVLLYTLCFCAFLLFARLFATPRWWLAVLAGATMGVAHLTKGSLLPALALWVLLFVVQTFWKRGDRTGEVGPRVLALLLVIVTFLAVTSAYLRTSKEVYGAYFFNVNSAIVVWCDSWPEALGWLELQHDREKWRALPADQIPSAAKYWREHSLSQVVNRFARGLRSLATQKAMAVGHYKFMVGLVLLAGVMWVSDPRRGWQLVAENPFGAAFAFLFCAFFIVAFAWFDAITSDTRFILTLFLPVVFTASLFIIAVGRDRSFSIAGRRLPFAVLLSGVLLSLSLVDVFYNAWRGFGN